MKGKSALQVLLCIDLEPDQLYPVPGQEETWEGSRAAFAWAKRWRAAGPGRHIYQPPGAATPTGRRCGRGGPRCA